MRRVAKSGIVGLALLLALTACAGRSSKSATDEELVKELVVKLFEDQTARVLTYGKPPNVSLSQYTVQAALHEISELHIAPQRTVELVRRGFAALAEASPDLRFDADKGEIVVSYRDEELYLFREPPNGAYALWAERIETSIDRILQKSPKGSRLDPESAVDILLGGMSSGLDKFTRYRPREDVLFHQRYHDGEIAGIGVEAELTRSGAVVQSIFDFSILDNEALKIGDTIVAIDGVFLAGQDRTTINSLFYGQPGSMATLSILRSGQREPMSVTVGRNRANETTLRSRRMEDMLYVQIVSMPSRLGARLTDALRAASESGKTELKGVILDLRGSAGGLLASGLAIADTFLADGEMVTVLSRAQADNQSFRARENAPTNRLPLVVLIDRATAGSAEVVAAALQDVGRAVVLGQPTLGQGLLQSGIRLPNGGALMVTWGEAVTPGGYRIDGRGVMPMVCTGGKLPAADVVAAVEKGVGVIDRATRRRDIASEGRGAIETFRALCPPRGDGKDVDVEVARALLEQPELYAQVLELGGAPGRTPQSAGLRPQRKKEFHRQLPRCRPAEPRRLAEAGGVDVAPRLPCPPQPNSLKPTREFATP